MVRIINYKKRQAEDKEFFVLEVSGGIEMVLSKATNQFYATAKKATLTSTFDEETCKALIGSEFPGSVVKQICEPYEYIVKETGEVITLNHRYVYTPEEVNSVHQSEPEMQNFKANVNEFSRNGKYSLAD